MVRFHGYFTFTCGLITTPLPIFAPNMRSKATLIELTNIHPQLMNHSLTKYHTSRFTNPPPVLYQELSYFDKSDFVHIQLFQYFIIELYIFLKAFILVEIFFCSFATIIRRKRAFFHFEDGSYKLIYISLFNHYTCLLINCLR